MKNKMKNKIGRTGGEKNGGKNSAPKRARRFIIGTAAAVFAIHSAAAAEVSAVATIAPLHSILQNIVGETDAVHLLVDPDGSPHHARLSPSRARLLQNADAVFYLDESFERFIKRPLRTTPENARIRLANHLRIAKYNEHHSEHDEHENHSDEHDFEHGHSEHDEHENHSDEHDSEHGHSEHDEHENHSDEHDSEHGDRHGELDFHIWLDADLTRDAARQMAKKLAEINPPRAAEYAENLRNLEKRLSDLDARLQKILTPLRDRPFMTMHDAYGYFVRRYELSFVGALHGGHAESLSAKRLRETRRTIAESGAVCIFGEPQLPARQLTAATENLNIKTGELDPLGANLQPGADLYFDLMTQMARALSDCLSPS